MHVEARSLGYRWRMYVLARESPDVGYSPCGFATDYMYKLAAKILDAAAWKTCSCSEPVQKTLWTTVHKVEGRWKTTEYPPYLPAKMCRYRIQLEGVTEVGLPCSKQWVKAVQDSGSPGWLWCIRMHGTKRAVKHSLVITRPGDPTLVVWCTAGAPGLQIHLLWQD